MKTKIGACLLVLGLLTMPIMVFAADNACSAALDNSSLPRCVNQIYIWSLGIAALLALFMIVIGGYITMTSAGNAQRAGKGKEYITSSVVGLILLFGAYLLLNTINPDLVNFNLDALDKPPAVNTDNNKTVPRGDINLPAEPTQTPTTSSGSTKK